MLVRVCSVRHRLKLMWREFGFNWRRAMLVRIGIVQVYLMTALRDAGLIRVQGLQLPRRQVRGRAHSRRDARIARLRLAGQKVMLRRCTRQQVAPCCGPARRATVIRLSRDSHEVSLLRPEREIGSFSPNASNRSLISSI